MARKVGYWLSHTDAISVEEDHAATVLAEPARFGLDREEVLSVYRRHDESPGSEGFARDEVIRMAAKNGWLRLRIQNSNGRYIVVQGYEPEKHMDRVTSFLCDLVHRDLIAVDETIVLSDFAKASMDSVEWTEGGAASIIANGCLDL
jgi:hypothetical protein